MSELSFSIVVATKGRVALLIDLMKSIKVTRDNYSGDCEVLIIDDSSDEESREIQEACKKYDCIYVYFKNGVSAKRNHGVSLAGNDVILFLDSDCIATEHMIEQYAEKYADPKVAAVAGPLEFVGPDTWFWKAIEATPYLTCFYLPKYVPYLEWGVTANFSVRREVFLEVGGFDESFVRPAGEDVDLGIMIRDAGYEIAGSPKSLVYHSKKTWIPVKAMFRRLHFYGSADCDLITKHPERGEVVLPKRSFLYIIYTVLIALVSLAAANPLLLLGIPALILLENIITSVLVNLLSEEKKATLGQQMVAQVLIHDSEISYLCRCIKIRNFFGIKRQMIYYLGQYQGMLRIGSYTSWVGYGCFAAIMIMILMLIV